MCQMIQQTRTATINLRLLHQSCCLIALQRSERPDRIHTPSDIDTAHVYNASISSSEDSPKIAFRMFAFLPYGKGVFASRTYALDLNNSTMYAIDFNDGYTGSIPKYPSPSFMNAEFMGDPLAFSSGPCYESIDLTAGDSSVIVIGGGNENEGACVCKVDNGGFKRSRDLERRVQDDLVCNEYSDPLVAYTLSEGVVELSLGLEDDDMVASSFYYGLDPSSDSEYSYNAFHDTDSLAEDDVTVSLYHGIVRADQVATDPSAAVPLDVLTIDAENVADGNLVVGGVWIDSNFGVHYSREAFIPLSEVVDVEVSSNEASDSGTEESSTQLVRESSLCPAGSIRNIASSSQGSFVLDVSSSYSESYVASNAIDEDPSTEWSTAGDGNDAYMTIQLPFPSNIVYVDFYTRTMTTSAQISEYQVEAGNAFGLLDIVASSCEVPDATRSYDCDLELNDKDDPLSGGAKNVTLVTFRVISSSGGNTGAVDISVYGCSMADEELDVELNGENAEEEVAVEAVAPADNLDIPKDTSRGTTKKLTNIGIAVLVYVMCAVQV